MILFIKANRVIGGAAGKSISESRNLPYRDTSAMVSLLIFASLFIAILVYGVNFQSKPGMNRQSNI